MTPASVGVTKTSLVMGKHSGRAAFRYKLKEMGYDLGDNQLEDAFTRFKELADRKKHVYDEDIEALVDENIATAHDRIKLVSLTVIAGTRGPQRATMKLDVDGRVVTEEAEGNGPVDAVFNAIKAIVPHEATLELYDVHAVTEGTDAQAEVSVRLSRRGRARVTGRGADPDTLVSSAKAYLAALNKLIARGASGCTRRRRRSSGVAASGTAQCWRRALQPYPSVPSGSRGSPRLHAGRRPHTGQPLSSLIVASTKEERMSAMPGSVSRRCIANSP